MKTIALMTASAFLGAVLAIILTYPLTLQARGEGKKVSGLLQSYNMAGKRVGLLGPGSQEQGTIFLFNEQGQTTHQIGSYGAGAEKGQSLYGMHDTKGQLRALLRLHGRNDSPTLIFKDSTGYDKIIIGLGGTGEAPYFRYVDEKGQYQDLLGR